jgi:hypothetical protein
MIMLAYARPRRPSAHSQAVKSGGDGGYTVRRMEYVPYIWALSRLLGSHIGWKSQRLPVRDCH